MRYFICLSYDGSNYSGWQVQQNTDKTIQFELEAAFSLVLAQPISLVGCGRTDAGVHAKDYIAHFDNDRELPIEISELTHRVNGILSSKIAVHWIRPVKEDTHARFSALSRTYQYHINVEKLPFVTNFSWYRLGKLNIEKMNEACQCLLGKQDFTTFSKLHTQTKTNDCAISYASWKKEGAKLQFTISADRFLRNMVRAIVGTLLWVGEEKVSVQQFEQLIESKDRGKAGPSVEARGLFLMKVTYPDDIYLCHE